jgi:hypothetical protein
MIELDAGLPPRDARAALAVGDSVTLFDGTGGEYAATLVHGIDKRGASVRVERFAPSSGNRRSR